MGWKIRWPYVVVRWTKEDDAFACCVHRLRVLSRFVVCMISMSILCARLPIVRLYSQWVSVTRCGAHRASKSSCVKKMPCLRSGVFVCVFDFGLDPVAVCEPPHRHIPFVFHAVCMCKWVCADTFYVGALCVVLQQHFWFFASHVLMWLKQSILNSVRHISSVHDRALLFLSL